MVRVVQPEVRTVITSQQTVVRVEYIREKKNFFFLANQAVPLLLGLINCLILWRRREEEVESFLLPEQFSAVKPIHHTNLTFSSTFPQSVVCICQCVCMCFWTLGRTHSPGFTLFQLSFFSFLPAILAGVSPGSLSLWLSDSESTASFRLKKKKNPIPILCTDKGV